MAAGDIILSNGTTVTAEDIQQIAAEVKKNLAAESKELSQFEEVSSLANVTSLPGIQTSGATSKLVRVALSVLQGLDGRDVELSASQTAIQWRYVGESAWKTLVELSLLKGEKGDKGDKGDTGAQGIQGEQGETKMPILSTVEATSGSTPSGSFTADGLDDSGNPKYKLALVLPKGDKGEPPVIEQGTTTTGLPDTEASVEVVANGETPEGNPKYKLNFTIPRGTPGQDGTGSGNVYVVETGLQSGKKYLFQPGANNSANGTFVEYVEPEIPEQVQPDWNATEGKGAILNKPSILPDAPKDGKQYARKDGAWAEVEAGDELSKDAIEQALTGNITTHRHDTMYNYTEFETDVWDGSSISSSLQGSGTKDDPYLIQSCADWVYLRSHATDLVPSSATSFVVFELKKNLDFGNKPISTASVASISGLEIDGGGATISNYTGSDGILGIEECMICFFHDINLKNINIQISDPKNIPASGFFGGQGDAIYNAVQNVTIHGTVTISGDLDEDTNIAIGTCIYLGYIAMAPVQGSDPAGYIRDYTKERGFHLGLDVTVDDQTVKTNGAKLIVQRCIVIVRTAEEDAEVKLEGYDSSFSNITSFESTGPVFEGNFGIITAVAIQSTDGNSASFDVSGFYRNSEKSQGIVLNTTSGLSQMADTPTKTTAEMQSDAFVELLNEGMETPVFLKDKNGGTPVLAPKNATIGYDGYVRKSEFEEFKSNLPTYEPVEPTTKSVVYTDINFFQANQGSNSRYLTEENFIENLGGVDAVKEMIRMIADTETVITSTVLMYIVPVLVTSTAKVYINQTKSDQSEPEDGDSFVFNMEAVLDNGSELNSLYVSCSVTNFNKENMTVEITRRNARMVESEEIRIIKKLTQSEYDGLSSKDSETLYVIVG